MKRVSPYANLGVFLLAKILPSVCKSATSVKCNKNEVCLCQDDFQASEGGK